MIEVFITVVDKLYSYLSKYIDLRNSENEKLFDEIVEPIFRQYEPLAMNYLQMFAEARDYLTQNTPDVSKVIQLRTKREEFLLLRVKLRAFVSTYQEIFKLDEYDWCKVNDIKYLVFRFLIDVENFFFIPLDSEITDEESLRRVEKRHRYSGAFYLVQLFNHLEETYSLLNNNSNDFDKIPIDLRKKINEKLQWIITKMQNIHQDVCKSYSKINAGHTGYF